MMTRGQVAKRLQVSIAAIRKSEGEHLHPKFCDGRWIFDDSEVDALAELRARGGGRLAMQFDDPKLVQAGRNGYRRTRSERRERSHSGLVDLSGPSVLPSSSEEAIRDSQAAAEHRRDERRLAEAVGELLSELDSATEAQLRRFFASNPDVEHLLEHVARLLDGRME